MECSKCRKKPEKESYKPIKGMFTNGQKIWNYFFNYCIVCKKIFCWDCTRYFELGDDHKHNLTFCEEHWKLFLSEMNNMYCEYIQKLRERLKMDDEKEESISAKKKREQDKLWFYNLLDRIKTAKVKGDIREAALSGMDAVMHITNMKEPDDETLGMISQTIEAYENK